MPEPDFTLASRLNGVNSVDMLKPVPARERSLRIAHLTDIHVQPERGAPRAMELAICHVQSQNDRADLILTGGDLVMDSLGADESRTRDQWRIFDEVLKANLELPIEHTVGNHDVWGWCDRAAHAEKSRFGKTWACEVLGLDRPYRSFDRAGWHFVILDSTHAVEGDGYIAKLDEAQFEWLQGDLAGVPSTTPILVVSHIPIICACAMFDGDNEASGDWVIPGAWVHLDARRIKNLFRQYPNVKCCLSGHIHLVDEVAYNGVRYFCNGAVCADWWKGDFYDECTYGYGLVDLFDDGTFDVEYVPYGWQTQPR